MREFTIKLEKLDDKHTELKRAPMTATLLEAGFKWISEPVTQYKKKKEIYDRVQVGAKKTVWKSGDFVYHDRQIGQIVYFFEKRQKCCAHLKMYVKGKHTVLEDTSDPHEIFESRECHDVGLSQIEVIFLNFTFFNITN